MGKLLYLAAENVWLLFSEGVLYLLSLPLIIWFLGLLRVTTEGKFMDKFRIMQQISKQITNKLF